MIIIKKPKAQKCGQIIICSKHAEYCKENDSSLTGQEQKEMPFIPNWKLTSKTQKLEQCRFFF